MAIQYDVEEETRFACQITKGKNTDTHNMTLIDAQLINSL